mmetsp:Transcript_6739/g.17713  ORF Transcript_6739/g.17713 Transcript_6739/m.17713 type:complete len:106 (-) Transcript_6739:195-512(-)
MLQAATDFVKKVVDPFLANCGAPRREKRTEVGEPVKRKPTFGFLPLEERDVGAEEAGGVQAQPSKAPAGDMTSVAVKLFLTLLVVYNLFLVLKIGVLSMLEQSST